MWRAQVADPAALSTGTEGPASEQPAPRTSSYWAEEPGAPLGGSSIGQQYNVSALWMAWSSLPHPMGSGGTVSPMPGGFGGAILKKALVNPK